MRMHIQKAEGSDRYASSRAAIQSVAIRLVGHPPDDLSIPFS